MKFRLFILTSLATLYSCDGLLSGSDGGPSIGIVGSDATTGRKPCEPCTHNSQCGGATDHCVSNGSGERFCAQDCSSGGSCPKGWSCTAVDAAEKQCIPPGQRCVAPRDANPEPNPNDAASVTPGADAAPTPVDFSPTPDWKPPASCDPKFLGPFCSGYKIIGFSATLPANPNLAQVRAYSVAAVNALRARTCLPPLVLDDCLNSIAEKALAAKSGHGYFLANCLDAAHNFGRNCECNWTQENVAWPGGGSLVNAIQGPLCGMMSEPKGVAHRSNIESKHWKRIGVGIKWSKGVTWYHEFGCDLKLSSCPKNDSP